MVVDTLTIEVKNYRSFTGEPVRLEFPRGGFLALVGTNNAGKTSLLRMFWELRLLFQRLQAYAQPGHGSMRNLLDGSVDGSPVPSTLAGERIFPTRSDADPEITFGLPSSPHGADDAFWPTTGTVQILRSGGFRLQFAMADGPLARAQATGVGNARGPGDNSPIYRVGTRHVDVSPLHDVMSILADAMYIGPFRNAINIGAEQAYFDLAIGDAFIRQLAEMKSGTDTAANEAIFTLTEELARIFKFTSLDINPAPDHTSIQLIVDGRSYRSSELGAGFAHFLLVASTVLRRRPSLLLIDEPELNLHPALQVDFLTMLGSYASFSTGYSTHSLGLARSTADRLYAVTRDDAGVSRCDPYEATPELASLLGQLGYTGVNDFQYDGVLLVEGITDVRTFLQLLRL